MKSSFDNSVAILVKAYLNNTLQKGNCHACAVGNLIAASCDYQFVGEKPQWSHALDAHSKFNTWVKVFCSNPLNADGEIDEDIIDGEIFRENQTHWQETDLDNYTGVIKQEIDSTGYTVDQLRNIEWAFETASTDSGSEGEFQGLMAVVEVLAQIHYIPLEQAQEAKSLFVKV